VGAANLGVVRGLIAALNRRDVEAMVGEFYTADAEFIPALQAALEGTVYRGSAAIRAYYEEIYDVWEELRVEATDLRGLGDIVLATGRVVARGKASGVALDREWAFAFKLVDRKVVWQRNFFGLAEALRVLGLSDQP
jgi:ketosteroid isomerase-like protein